MELEEYNALIKKIQSGEATEDEIQAYRFAVNPKTNKYYSSMAALSGDLSSWDGSLSDNGELEKNGFTNAYVSSQIEKGVLEGGMSKDFSDKLLAYQQASEAESKFISDRDYAKQDAYNIAKGVGDVQKGLEAQSQIRKGSRELDRLKSNRPTLPNQNLSEDLRRATSEAASRAGRGFSNQTLGATASRDLSGYASAINAARNYGAGQASASGAMAGKAYRDILDRNLSTAVANQNANDASFSQYASLANSRANELSGIRNAYNTDYLARLKEHNRAMGEAAALERTGRINRANLMSTVPTTAANLTRQYYRAGESRGDIPLLGTPERVAYDEQRREKRSYNRQLRGDWLREKLGRNKPTKEQSPEYGYGQPSMDLPYDDDNLRYV